MSPGSQRATGRFAPGGADDAPSAGAAAAGARPRDEAVGATATTTLCDVAAPSTGADRRARGEKSRRESAGARQARGGLTNAAL